MSPAKKVSVHDIARLARVSIGTVDRALHGRKEIKFETRQRILHIAGELGYKPNLAARWLAEGCTPLRVGVCIPREIHFFYDEVRRGMMEEACRFESVGVSILHRPAARLGAGEVERVRELLDSDIRALILTPGDPEGLSPVIDEAEKRGIPVLCVCSDAPKSRRSTVICVEPELNGCCAAELMAKFVPPNSEVAVVTGMLQVEDHRQKARGFCQAFPRFCLGGKVVEVIENHEDAEEARRNCVSLLDRYPSLGGLYVSTVNCLSVCAALDGAGRSGQVRLITTDLFPEMAPFIRNGTIFASVHQRPYRQGQMAVRVAVDRVVNGVPILPSYYLNPQIVLQSNLTLFGEISPAKQAERAEVPDSSVS